VTDANGNFVLANASAPVTVVSPPVVEIGVDEPAPVITTTSAAPNSGS